MTTTLVNVTNSGSGILYSLDGHDLIVVGTNGAAASTNSSPIVGIGSNNTVEVQGTVVGELGAILLGNTNGADIGNKVTIGTTGYVSSNASIQSGASTVHLNSAGSYLNNEGTISNQNALGAGVIIASADVSSLSIMLNSGTINSSWGGIAFAGSGNFLLENTGSILSSIAISGTSVLATGSITAFNTGRIVGSVQLGLGSDTFDTRDGILIGGVQAGLGNDNLLGSTADDFFEGQDGDDKIYGYNGNDRLFGDAGNDILTGGNGNDTLTGGTELDILFGEAGNDIIDGGSGKDMIYGGLGKDSLTGGADGDRFIFRTRETGNSKTTADTILDFQSIDDIDLSSIDASTKHAGNDKFTFIGTQGFHGKAGELRYEKAASDTWIYGDTNGDRKVDLVIHLDDPLAMAKGYFYL